jgi:hypothetical protein
MAHHEVKGGKLEMQGPPSFAWTGAALVAAHKNLWLAFQTLNDCCQLGLDANVQSEATEFQNLWKNR